MIRRMLAALILLSLLPGNIARAQEPPPDWAHQLVRYTLTICKAPPPTELRLEAKSLEWLRNESKKGIPWGHPARDYPRYIKALVSVQDVADRKLIIYIADWDVETLLHEALHYCVAHMFERGFSVRDEEGLTRTLTNEFLLSNHIQNFLKTQGR